MDLTLKYIYISSYHPNDQDEIRRVYKYNGLSTSTTLNEFSGPATDRSGISNCLDVLKIK